MACILVVEDDPYILMLAQAMLEDAGYETMAAVTMGQALGFVRSSRTVDLVFTDMELGGDADGGNAISAVMKEVRPRTPVLYTSGNAMKYAPFVAKPYTRQTLTTAVAKLLRGGTGAS